MAAVTRAAQVQTNLAAVEARIVAACQAAGRARAEVTLIGVTKTWPASDVAILRDLGVVDVAENRDQEAADKVTQVDGVHWHFVGAVQTNKATSVASYADVVHAVDRVRLVRALGSGAQKAGRLVRVLIQVSLDGDPARGGAAPPDVPALAEQVARTAGLDLGGLMAVAPLAQDAGRSFARLAAFSAQLRATHPTASWISAGMSSDLEAAVQNGATHLRVGTAILGVRPPLRR